VSLILFLLKHFIYRDMESNLLQSEHGLIG